MSSPTEDHVDPSSRARALLGSLKEHRQFFEARIAEKQDQSMSIQKPASLLASCPPEISREIESSISDRRSRLRRAAQLHELAPSSPSGGIQAASKTVKDDSSHEISPTDDETGSNDSGSTENTSSLASSDGSESRDQRATPSNTSTHSMIVRGEEGSNEDGKPGLSSQAVTRHFGDNGAVYVEKMYAPFRQCLVTPGVLKKKQRDAEWSIGNSVMSKHKNDLRAMRTERKLGALLDTGDLAVVPEHCRDRPRRNKQEKPIWTSSSLKDQTSTRHFYGMDLVHSNNQASLNKVFSFDDSILISDASSFDCSTDDGSNTSGWLSSCEEYIPNSPLVGYPSAWRRRRRNVLVGTSLFAKKAKRYCALTKEELRKPHDNKRVIFADNLVSTPSSLKPLNERQDPPLVVDEEQSDQACLCTGGLYDLAISSGMTEDTSIPQYCPESKSSVPRMLSLSTDFRCGAHGSLYDLAVRSGCEIDKPLPSLLPQPLQPTATPVQVHVAATLSPFHGADTADARPHPKRRGRVIPALGGLYYTALRSGLTEADLTSRRGFTVFTRKSAAESGHGSYEIVAEDVADASCGTRGGMYTMALQVHSTTGDYHVLH